MFDVVVFEGPDMLAEFGGVSVFGVAEYRNHTASFRIIPPQTVLDPSF